MPFMPASIPQLNYASYAYPSPSPSGSASYYSTPTYSPASTHSSLSPYSTSSTHSASYCSSAYPSSPRYSVSPCLPPPSSRSPQDNRTLNDQHVSLRSHLRNRLEQGRLKNVPMGFPFHCAPSSGHKGKDVGYAISYSSYEFPEYLYLDSRSQPLCAVFSYTAPSFGSHAKSTSSSSRMMTWRITVPSRDTTHPRQHSSKVTMAHVEVDPLVMETPLGLEFMTNARILFKALAVSLELGLRISIQVSDNRTQSLYSSRRGVRYRAGEIIFIATNNDGRAEVVYVFEF